MKRIAVILILAAVATLWPGPVQAQAAPTFFYVVSTVDTNGFESAFTAQATATFNQGQKNAVLTWTAAVVPPLGAGVAGYNVWRSKTTGGPYVKINAALVTSVTYTDSFVPPNAATGLTALTN